MKRDPLILIISYCFFFTVDVASAQGTINFREKADISGIASTLKDDSTLTGVNMDLKGTDRPNILFVFADQYRKEAVSCYGGINIQTPNIDRLAQEGIRFSNALSTTPLCTPYRAMLMTGKYPTHTGMLLNFVNPQQDERGIGDVFNEAGYQTGFIGKWHLASGILRDHSMLEPKLSPSTLCEPEFVPPGRGRLGFQYWAAFNFHMNYRQGIYYRDTPEPQYYPDYEAEWMADDAIKFLEHHTDTDSDFPFFLMVAFHYPHPLWRGELDVSAEALKEIPENIQLLPNSKQKLPFEVVSFGGLRSLLTLEQVRTYYTMCAEVDKNFGRILEYLDCTGLANNTIVVFTSDHGEQLGSHGRKSKMLPFEESINIPLVIRWPEHIKAGALSEALYTPMDHISTLCTLVGIDPPNDIDGIDLSCEVLKAGEVQRNDVLIAHYVSAPNYCQAKHAEMQWRGVRSKTHTYAKNIDGEELLFDNIADPCQMTNLIGNEVYRPLQELMRRRLKQLLAEANDDLLSGNYYSDWFDDTRTVVRTDRERP
jgi:arylsulfatase A-like enzyme